MEIISAQAPSTCAVDIAVRGRGDYEEMTSRDNTRSFDGHLHGKRGVEFAFRSETQQVRWI